jgi:hypothetical protein
MNPTNKRDYHHSSGMFLSVSFDLQASPPNEQEEVEKGPNILLFLPNLQQQHWKNL